LHLSSIFILYRFFAGPKESSDPFQILHSRQEHSKFHIDSSHHLDFGMIWSISRVTSFQFFPQYLHLNQSLFRTSNLFFAGIIVIFVNKRKPNLYKPQSKNRLGRPSLLRGFITDCSEIFKLMGILRFVSLHEYNRLKTNCKRFFNQKNLPHFWGRFLCVLCFYCFKYSQ